MCSTHFGVFLSVARQRWGLGTVFFKAPLEPTTALSTKHISSKSTSRFNSRTENCGQTRIMTVCTVVQNCCKGDLPCQRNTPISRPQASKPLNRSTLNLIGVITSGLTPHTNFGIYIFTGAGLHMREIAIIRVYF